MLTYPQTEIKSSLGSISLAMLLHLLKHLLMQLFCPNWRCRAGYYIDYMCLLLPKWEITSKRTSRSKHFNSMAVKQKTGIPWVYQLLIAILPPVTEQMWLDNGDIWNLWLVQLVQLTGTTSQAATGDQRTSCWKLPRFAPCNMSGLFFFDQRLLQNIFPENKQNFAWERCMFMFLFSNNAGLIFPHFQILGHW